MRLVLAYGTSVELAEALQASITRALASRSVLAPPFAHLDIELTGDDAMPAVDRVRSALELSGEGPRVERIEPCPCPSPPWEPQEQSRQIYRGQRVCAGARAPIAVGGCAKEYLVVGRGQMLCIPVVFDAWAESSRQVPVRNVRGVFTHSGPDRGPSDGIVQWRPGGSGQVTSANPLVPLDLGGIFSHEPVYMRAARFSPGFMNTYIDPPGTVFWVDNSPASAKTSPVVLEGAVEVCQDSQFSRNYEVAVDFSSR